MPRSDSLALLLAAATMTATACGPNLQGKNVSAQFIEAVRLGDQASVQRLLGANATLTTTDGQLTDHAVVAKTLTALSLSSATVEAHHEVARLTMPGGQLLFVQATGAQISEVVLFPAMMNGERSSALRNYQDAWNVADSAGRTALLNQAWAASSRYVDPGNDVTGVAGLDATIASFQQSFPHTTISATSQVIALPGRWFLADWVLQAPDSTLSGFDVGRSSAEGQVELIAGFFTAR